MAKIQGPKGTRDFYPDEMRRRRHLEDVWRRVSLRAGFEEVDGPIFESLDLYIQKSGQEIVEQLYSFEDKGGRPVAIRPEFTPTLARMVVARQAALPRPVKWFNISRVCRYERAQKGRLREFFQWNCDILGAAGAAADAECILVAVDALRELGLSADRVEVRLSSRKLLAGLLHRLGLADDVIPRVYAALDKRGKVPAEVVDRMLDDAALSPEARRGIDEIFTYDSLDTIPAAVAADEAVAGPLDDLRDLFTLLGACGAADYVRFDINIVRGLAYYTGPVWEVFDKRGELRSLFGGGRYDNLIAATGGQPMPACGFGAGDVTMSLLLEGQGLWPPAAGRVACAVLYADEASMSRAAAVVRELRAVGRSAEYALNPSSFKRQLKSAADSGARYAVVVDVANMPPDRVRLRDMASGAEEEIALGELVERAKRDNF